MVFALQPPVLGIVALAAMLSIMLSLTLIDLLQLGARRLIRAIDILAAFNLGRDGREAPVNPHDKAGAARAQA